jgi:hypothetical protein
MTFSAAIPTNTQVVEAKWSTPTTTSGVSNITVSPTTVSGTLNFLHDATIGIVAAGQNITFSIGNYISSLANAVSRTFSDKQQDINTVFDFGVKCDNSTNDATTLQNAISATPVGGKLYIPYKNSGICLTNAALSFTKPIYLVCDPGVAIKPTSGIGGGNVMNFIGSPSGLLYPTIVENCIIGDPSVNTRFGTYGMEFDTTTAGNYFRGMELRNVTIKAGTNGVYGFLHANNVTNNPNGGMFASTIHGGTIEGGLNFSGSGDNIAVRDTLVPNNQTAGADNSGILVALAPGAGAFVLDHINFSQSGGIIFDSCYACSIENHSQIEAQSTITESNGALVDVRAGGATISGFKFRNNQVQANAGFGTPLLLRIGANVNTVIVDGNAFATPTAYSPVSNATADLRLGPNYWSVGAAAHISGTAASIVYGGG